jgi:predicted histone-like DNA-binding protein
MKYKIIPRRNPQDANAVPKYYAQIIRPESITMEKLAKRIAEISPVNELDTQSVLIAFTKVLPEYFIEGATVQLGDLGFFQTTLRSHGSETEEDFTTDLIKGFGVSYRSSTKVKNQYKMVKYTKVLAP